VPKELLPMGCDMDIVTVPSIWIAGISFIGRILINEQWKIENSSSDGSKSLAGFRVLHSFPVYTTEDSFIENQSTNIQQAEPNLSNLPESGLKFVPPGSHHSSFNF
jgi:hypothetical protein